MRRGFLAMAHATTSARRHHRPVDPEAAPEKPDAPELDPPRLEKLSMGWKPTPVVPALPLGVALISIGTAFTGFVLFLSGALILLNAYLPDTVPSGLLILSSADALGAAILLLVGTVFVGLANALWHQERWSLYLTVGLLFAAEAYLFFTATITVLFLLGLLVFVYLLTVRDHFY